ncbi:MAG: O-antigen ligase family protein [Blastochloris sp.]|nr:O-antigen ligase family protein [Blastochloris sp.]
MGSGTTNEMGTRSWATPFDLAITWIVLLVVATLLSVTTLYWGGIIHQTTVWIYPLGGLLWFCLAAKALLAQTTKQWLPSWIELSVFLFLLYAIWAFTYTPAKYAARFELLWIFTYASVFLSLRLALHNRRLAVSLLSLILILASICCVFALMNKGIDRHLIWGQMRPDYGPRISGTFGCPNHFANLMVMACCVATAIFLYPKTPWALRITVLYLVAMFSVGIFYSVSRGGYIAWLAGLATICAFVVFQRAISWKLRASMLVATLAVGGVFSYLVLNDSFAMSRLDAMWKGDIRQELAKDAIKIWETSPLVGTGMATFDFIHQRMHGNNMGSRAVHTHNDYLNLLADYGLIGVALVSFFFLCVLPFLLKRYINSEREFDLLVTRSALWVIIVMGVHSVVDFNFHIPACALTFFTILAIGCSRSYRQTSPSRHSLLPNLTLALCSLLAGSGLIYMSLPLHESTLQEKWKDQKLLALSAEELIEIGDETWQRDPYATPTFEMMGDGLRMKTYYADQAYQEAFKDGDTAKADQLLLKREDLGKNTLKMYARAAISNPIHDNILVKQGLLLDSLNRTQEAYLAYSKAVENRPKNMFYRYHLGFHFLKIKEYELAKEQFEIAMRTPAHLGLDRKQKEIALESLRILRETGNLAP